MSAYPVYIHREADGTASGFFPGVPGCYFAGDSVTECLLDARSALDAHFELLVEDGRGIPEPTTMDQHLYEEECVNGFWAIVSIDPTRFEGPVKRVQVTLPALLLDRIDRFVDAHHEEYESRSGFLASLARNELRRTA